MWTDKLRDLNNMIHFSEMPLPSSDEEEENDEEDEENEQSDDEEKEQSENSTECYTSDFSGASGISGASADSPNSTTNSNAASLSMIAQLKIEVQILQLEFEMEQKKQKERPTSETRLKLHQIFAEKAKVENHIKFLEEQLIESEETTERDSREETAANSPSEESEETVRPFSPQIYHKPLQISPNTTHPAREPTRKPRANYHPFRSQLFPNLRHKENEIEQNQLNWWELPAQENHRLKPNKFSRFGQNRVAQNRFEHPHEIQRTTFPQTYYQPITQQTPQITPPVFQNRTVELINPLLFLRRISAYKRSVNCQKCQNSLFDIPLNFEQGKIDILRCAFENMAHSAAQTKFYHEELSGIFYHTLCRPVYQINEHLQEHTKNQKIAHPQPTNIYLISFSEPSQI